MKGQACGLQTWGRLLNHLDLILWLLRCCENSARTSVGAQAESEAQRTRTLRC